MRKIISAVLISLILFGSGAAFTFSALNSFFEYDGSEGNNPDNDTDDPTPNPSPSDPTLVVPTYKDYGRDTVDFDKMVYQRPDIDGAVESFGELCDLVDANELPFAEQLDAIKGIYGIYSEISSMYSYANIMTSRDASDEIWSAEYEYISVNYPRFSQAVEKLFVSCARSVHAESFEEQYFGEGLIEEYSGGGKYSDAAVALMASEAELESEYSKIGMSTVKITIDGVENTPEYFLAYYYEKYGKNQYSEFTYIFYTTQISSLYYEKYAELTKPIYINLLKVRRLIADELGLDGYMEYAYDEMGHDYTAKKTLDFLDGIAEWVIPFHNKLYTEVLQSYPTPDGVRDIHQNDILNTLYALYKDMDGELSDAFSYMLQHGLFDIQVADSKRFDGAFTVYIDSYGAPFIFASTDGSVVDYFTITHEFGHFYDNFVNYGASSSLDLAEISSQALELLTLKRLESALGEEMVNYLLVLQISEMLNTLRTQGFFALFEHLAYELSYDEITEENLNAILLLCEEEFGYPAGSCTLNDILTVPHIVLYPGYVQSYCTSALVSFEIYFMEAENAGAGIDAYKKLVLKDSDSSFGADLEAAGLSSPLEQSFIKQILNKISRLMYGKDYFTTTGSSNAA